MDLTVKTDWRSDLDNIPYGVIRGALFSGDRHACCDEAVIAYEQDKFVGIATIAPRGENYCGTPDIVGLYVAREYRRQGYGLRILEAAIQRCLERHLPTPISITAISSSVPRLCDRLPTQLKEKIHLVDLSMGVLLGD